MQLCFVIRLVKQLNAGALYARAVAAYQSQLKRCAPTNTKLPHGQSQAASWAVQTGTASAPAGQIIAPSLSQPFPTRWDSAAFCAAIQTDVSLNQPRNCSVPI